MQSLLSGLSLSFSPRAKGSCVRAAVLRRLWFGKTPCRAGSSAMRLEYLVKRAPKKDKIEMVGLVDDSKT
jgi:predicted GIY-YIG superfamily endonuclease